MKKLYFKKTFAIPTSSKWLFFAVLLISAIYTGYSQVQVGFQPRTSSATPATTIYNIKGDFTMMGNTNLTLVNYNDTDHNANDMKYVDIDNDLFGRTTWNSSSATLTFSNENGADSECSKIIYAGIYWTGRAFDDGQENNDDGDNDPNTFTVVKGGVSRSFDKRRISLKGPLSNTYTDFTANDSDIFYPSNQFGNMFSAYVEVTDYVRNNRLGEYFVADLALREGASIDGTGYYGGWGMVIVYENSKMKYRNITVFDGHAYVPISTNFYDIDISGFNAVQNGNVNIKLGLMAGEGDNFYGGDYFQIRERNSTIFRTLSHSGNSPTNFFNSSIATGLNSRNPNLVNNTGLDIAMFQLDNTGNAIIDNNQTSTTLRYGTAQDTYIIFNVTFSVDAYIPEPVGVLTTASGGGTPLKPGESDNFKLEIRNQGTEDINNMIVTIPLPEYLNAGSTLNINTFLDPSVTAGAPIINPPNATYPFGFVTWDLGTLPLPSNPNTLLASISFTLTVTTSCSILNAGPVQKDIKLSGFFSGKGAVSGQEFTDIPFISGYENAAPCIGEPITDPITVGIDYIDYVDAPPTASKPNPITVQCPANIPVPDVEVVIDEADNSGTPVVTFISDVSDGNSNPETIIRTYRVTDDCNNFIDVTQTITVTNSGNPVVPTLADVIGECSATAPVPTTTGGCGGTITGTTTNPLTYNAQGTYTINWTFDDGNGNSIIVPQTVIVDDVTNPVAP
ncbi:HYR-like domain-containing protein, partial [Mariniflexile sp.]|uniref:HYR-like domain-containing protein n=1 Tax=Mariniflexile sp. TaxID=1979402 RepID=UPI0040472186